MSRSSPLFIYIKSFGTNFHMKPKLLSRPIHYEEHIINIFKKFQTKKRSTRLTKMTHISRADWSTPTNFYNRYIRNRKKIYFIIMEKIKNTTQIKQKGPSRPTRINQTSQDDWSATESTLIKSAKLIDILKSLLQY